AVREQRGEAVRRQGCTLGAVALYRSAAVDRSRLFGSLAGFVAADAALSAAHAVFRRGEGLAGEIRHTRIRSEEGRCAVIRQGVQEGRWFLDGSTGEKADARYHRLRCIGPSDWASAVRDAEAPRRGGIAQHAARF